MGQGFADESATVGAKVARGIGLLVVRHQVLILKRMTGVA